jgi:VanZ family protein
VLYLVLALLLISENHKKNKDKHGSIIPMLWILIIVIVYGGMIETFQYFFFTSRSASVLDMVANFLGFLVATITYPAVNRITKGYI